MRHPLGVSTLVAAAISVVAASAVAQPLWWPGKGGGLELVGFEPSPGPPQPGRPEGMARELGLSEAQQEQLRGIMDEQRAQREELYDKLAANRDALHQLLESASADATAVGELVIEGRKLHEESRALRDAEQKTIRAILTPEQQKKFDQALAQRRDRLPGRGPEGFGGRPPVGPGRPGAGVPGGQGGPGSRQPRPPIGTGKPGQVPQLP